MANNPMDKLRDIGGHVHALGDAVLPPAVDNAIHTLLPCLDKILPNYCNPAQNQHTRDCRCNHQSQPQPKPSPSCQDQTSPSCQDKTSPSSQDNSNNSGNQFNPAGNQTNSGTMNFK